MCKSAGPLSRGVSRETYAGFSFRAIAAFAQNTACSRFVSASDCSRLIGVEAKIKLANCSAFARSATYRSCWSPNGAW